ncbi:MAG: hypothetical protein WCX17_03695 [Parcubacteria group bacterium]|jgi:hypothetical protein
MDNNTWYYTLTTIAQTLAAILGLAAVFVTIRLQKLTEKLEYYKVRANYIAKQKPGASNNNIERTANGLFDELKDIIVEYEKYGKDSGFISGIAKLSATFEPNLCLDNLGFLTHTKDNLGIYIKQRKKILELVRLPGVFTSGTIIYVIILLSMSNLLYCNRLLFALAVYFSVVSILFIITASWELLKESVQKI